MSKTSNITRSTKRGPCIRKYLKNISKPARPPYSEQAKMHKSAKDQVGSHWTFLTLSASPEANLRVTSNTVTEHQLQPHLPLPIPPWIPHLSPTASTPPSHSNPKLGLTTPATTQATPARGPSKLLTNLHSSQLSMFSQIQSSGLSLALQQRTS